MGATLCIAAAGFAGGLSAALPFAAWRADGFGGFAGFRLGAAGRFFAVRFGVIAFFPERLRAAATDFFPCALAIGQKEWRSIAARGGLCQRSADFLPERVAERFGDPFDLFRVRPFDHDPNFVLSSGVADQNAARVAEVFMRSAEGGLVLRQ